MTTAHYKTVPPLGDPNEPIRYICLESPCKDEGVIIPAHGLDAHTIHIHGANSITVSF